MNSYFDERYHSVHKYSWKFWKCFLNLSKRLTLHFSVSLATSMSYTWSQSVTMKFCRTCLNVDISNQNLRTSKSVKIPWFITVSDVKRLSFEKSPWFLSWLTFQGEYICYWTSLKMQLNLPWEKLITCNIENAPPLLNLLMVKDSESTFCPNQD